MMLNWRDFDGRVRPVSLSRGRLDYTTPGNSALRAYVHRRDGFACMACGVEALDVPMPYTGLSQLVGPTDCGYVFFVLDHVKPLAVGGTHAPNNLQTLCEPCNMDKLRQVDMPEILAYRYMGRRLRQQRGELR